MTLLAALTWGQWAVTLILIAVCALLMLIILVQQASGGGLVGAFGGGGGGSSAFGAKTGDVFTVITVVLASVYLLVAITGNYVFEPAGSAPGATVGVQPGIPLDDAGTIPPADGGTSAPTSPPSGAAEQPAQQTTTDGSAGSEPVTGNDAAPAAAGGTVDTGQDDSQKP